MDEELKHYGTPRRSGRYPWGSGDDPEQRNKTLSQKVRELKKQGTSEVDIAKGFGMKTSELRNRISLEKDEQKRAEAALINKLVEKGYSNMEISRRTGIPEPTIRNRRKAVLQEKANLTKNTADMLKENVEKHKYVDIGVGVENHLQISRTKLKTAVASLKDEGYTVHYIKVPQLGTTHDTRMMVLAKPGTTYSEVYKNRFSVKQLTGHSEDRGRSFTGVLGLEPIRSVDSKRILIRYGDKGGANKDGVIELRRGVDDISLGNARYAQVRIGVDGTHYLKGMAMYADKMPDGIDIIYNTNKKSGIPKEEVFKKMEKNDKGEIDKDNPFGSSVRQKHYIDASGKKQLSALQMVGLKEGSGEEGAWEKWSRTLSSQFLSKQSPSLAKKQLDLAFKSKKEEYDEIMSLTNPVIKKALLTKFADDCDASSVHLKAAALPRQQSHVILPLPKMKENEIYAPNYRDGERVVLIRHPHGGTFEIPELVVNNRDQTAKKLLGNVRDAVGIHPNVANKLSGADFDGDTVLVIPNKNRLVKTTPSLKGLADFDPKASYPPYDKMRTIDGGIYDAKTRTVDFGGKKPRTATKQMKMGDVSNLITDMTLKGAHPDEIARAVRHSMVVIDSEKHSLDYKRSYQENGIGALKKRYQGKETAGAATLISKAKSQARVAYREEGKKIVNPITGKSRRVYVDPNTGKKLYEEYPDKTFTTKDGRVIKQTTKITKMAKEDDAFALSSGTPMEAIYATHANKLKAFANAARLDALHTPNLVYSPSAKKTYALEVLSLNAKLKNAKMNKPLERQAQLLGNAIVKSKKDSNPNMTADDLSKIKAQALAEARSRVQAKKTLVEITDKEWEAIQAGAISNNTLKEIIDNADPNRIKQLATPRTSTTMTATKVAKARAMLEAGYTQAEIADSLGVSISTLSKSFS